MPNRAAPCLLLCLAACSGAMPGKDRPIGKDPSDGQGTITIDGPASVTRATKATFTIRYQAGPAGIAEGGGILLQISPFWGWSPPQTSSPEVPGYLAVENSGEAQIELEIGKLSFAIARLASGHLAPGETVTFRYGPARVDRFAEREEGFLVKTDGNGDGFFAPLEAPGVERPELLDGQRPSARITTLKSFGLSIEAHQTKGEHAEIEKPKRYGRRPSARSATLKGARSISIEASAPTRLLLTASSFPNRAGDLTLCVAALDAVDDVVEAYRGTVTFVRQPGGLPASYPFTAEDRGAHRFTFRGDGDERFRITARDDAAGISGMSNVIQSTPLDDRYRLFFADLHGHSNLSDGTGTPEDYFRYARDVSGLDIAALTDHDAHGLRPLDEHPDLFGRIKRAAKDANQPGRFVTFPAYEWTNWTFGHMHVLFSSEAAAKIVSMRRRTTPEELWKALPPGDAITIPHHPGGGPVPFDWNHYDRRFMPLVEITSIHGSSAYLGTPRMIYRPVAGHFVKDALARGYPLGILGSGDTHNGHPGQGDRKAPTSGLAGIFATELTRSAVWDALEHRRVFATSGPRICLSFSVAGTLMGGVLDAPVGSTLPYTGTVYGSERIERIEIVRNGEVVGEARPHASAATIRGEETAVPPQTSYYYLHVLQFDEGEAWSSPVFVHAK